MCKSQMGSRSSNRSHKKFSTNPRTWFALIRTLNLYVYHRLLPTLHRIRLAPRLQLLPQRCHLLTHLHLRPSPLLNLPLLVHQHHTQRRHLLRTHRTHPTLLPLHVINRHPLREHLLHPLHRQHHQPRELPVQKPPHRIRQHSNEVPESLLPLPLLPPPQLTPQHRTHTPPYTPSTTSAPPPPSTHATQCAHPEQ